MCVILNTRGGRATQFFVWESQVARKVRKVGRPTGSNREETISRAINSARKLFNERGYSATTLKDVGLDMGVTHATLYLYFDSKVDLYCKTVEVTQELLRPGFEEVLAKDLSCKEKLIQLLRVAMVDIDGDSSRSSFMAGVPIDLMRHQELRDALDYKRNKMAQTLLSLFEEGIASGEVVAEATAEDLLVLFMGGLLGMNIFHQGGQIGSVNKALELFVSMFDQGVFAGD
jgi:AcrR family transcriptional regulator